MELNRDRVPAPGGGDWGFSTIVGNPTRRTGLLHNELYVGRLVWNRQRCIKDPDSGKRIARLNPEFEWIVQEAPHLCIIDDGLWQRVKERPGGDQPEARRRWRRRCKPVPVLGAPAAEVLVLRLVEVQVLRRRLQHDLQHPARLLDEPQQGHVRQPDQHRRDRLEARVFAALYDKLMDPALFRAFCEEFIRETNRLRIEVSTTLRHGLRSRGSTVG